MIQKLGKHIFLVSLLIFHSLILTGCIKDEEKNVIVEMNAVDELVASFTNLEGNYVIKTSPKNGNASLTITRTTAQIEGRGTLHYDLFEVIYTPNTDYIGKDLIKLTKTLADINSTISINITVVKSDLIGNNKPTADDKNITIDYETETDFNITGSDEDNDTLIFVIESNTSNGTIVLIDETTGDVTYTPNQGYSGADHFTFKVVDDNNASSNSADVNITVKSLCDLDPAAPGCPLDPCEIDPTDFGCPLDPCILDLFSIECQNSIPI